MIDLKEHPDIYDLIDLIDLLRSEDGCPWDKVQTHDSIKGALLEESYEVVDAINKNDLEGMKEELGDVLMQVVFHASIENENNNFNFNDIVKGVYDKMIYRHPHVFTDEKDTEAWDELKKKEKKYNSVTEELNGVANALPALVRAKKVQSKAAKVGFDFENLEEASKKVIEELNEVLTEYKFGNQSRILEEVGDLIFSCVNVARFLNINPEDSLQKTTDKFIKRFDYIEDSAIKMNKKVEELDIKEMDQLWSQSKNFK